MWCLWWFMVLPSFSRIATAGVSYEADALLSLLVSWRTLSHRRVIAGSDYIAAGDTTGNKTYCQGRGCGSDPIACLQRSHDRRPGHHAGDADNDKHAKPHRSGMVDPVRILGEVSREEWKFSREGERRAEGSTGLHDCWRHCGQGEY